MHKRSRSSPLCPCLSPCPLLLLLTATVNQKVRIHNIGIKGPKEDGTGPKQVKLFINRHSFGFSDADSVPCAQELDLTAKDLDGEPIPLKLTKVRGQEALRAAARETAGQYSRGMLAAVGVVRHGSIPEALLPPLELCAGCW